MSSTVDVFGMPSAAARLIAIEVLLAQPEALDDDVLESCLYILRERLLASGSQPR